MSMNPRFLEFYNQELQYIREMAHEFGQRYPKLAGHLGLHASEVDDPYVERLLEGFAFLTARVQLKMDHEFPGFCEQLLECLNPNAMAPLPAMSIGCFRTALEDSQLLKGPKIEAGRLLKSTHRGPDGMPATFKTAHAVQLWPIEIGNIKYNTQPPQFLNNRKTLEKTKAAVSIQLNLPPEINFAQLEGLNQLDFFVQQSEEQAFELFDHLMLDQTQVWATDSYGKPLHDKAFELIHLGFDDSQALLPTSALNFSGFRLIHEMLSFPQRFLFFRINDLQQVCATSNLNQLQLHIGLKISQSRFIDLVDHQSLALFCTPVINLFKHSCDQVQLKQKHRALVLPDRTHPQNYEVHSIISVQGHTSATSQGQVIPPIYGQGNLGHLNSVAYSIERQTSVESESRVIQGGRTRYLGSEMYLSLSSQANNPHPFKCLSVSANCTNRDLPLLLPFASGSDDFQPLAELPNVGIRLILSPTRPVSKLLIGKQVWQLIQHCSLNYFSMVQDGSAAEALMNLLQLHANPTRSEQMAMTQSILNVQCEPSVQPLKTKGRSTFIRGLEINVDADVEQMHGYGLIIPGAVLAHFFARFVSINSFVQMRLRGEQTGFEYQWPPMSGQRPLL